MLEKRREEKKRFRNIRSKISNLYVLMCRHTSYVCFIALYAKRKEKKNAPKNCSYCEIFCFINYGLNKNLGLNIFIGRTHHTYQKKNRIANLNYTKCVCLCAFVHM